MSRLSKNAQETTDGPTALEQVALDWFARCDRGLTPEQEVEFERWLAADPRHAQVFNELDGTWTLLARATPAASSETPQATGVTRIPARRAWRMSWLPVGLAAAAALAIGSTVMWRATHYTATTVTEIGRMQTTKLPDGSLMTINTDSVVAVAFTSTERRVRLARGEVHFTVAKNPARPFVVEAGGVSVQAVGTAFNVRLRSAAVEVLVTEGRVRVDDTARGESLLPPGAAAVVGATPSDSSSAQRTLGAGQRAVVTRVPASAAPAMRAPEATVVPVAQDEIQRELAWQERRLDFASAALTDMVAEFNRYNRHQIVIADPRLAARNFGGSFKPDDYAGFVRMLQENFGVVATTTGNQTALRLAP